MTDKIIHLPNVPRKDVPQRQRHPVHNMAVQIDSLIDWYYHGEIDADTCIYLIREHAINIIAFWEGSEAPKAKTLLQEALPNLSRNANPKERTKTQIKIRDYLKRNGWQP